MMTFVGLLIGFLILVYVYNYLKLRKRRQNQIDTVAEYHRQFHRQFDSHRTRTTLRSRNNLKDSNYNNYITKFNSKTDYISKDDLFL